jgi:hypothetical protein
MYTLRLTNLETLEIIENYYFDLEIAPILFNDRLNVLSTVYFEKFELELIDQDGTCLAYADSHMNGGLLWKLDEEDEDFGDWDWALLDEWEQDGISAPVPKPDMDAHFKFLLDDFGIDDDYIEDWGDDEDFELFEDEEF